MTKAYYGDEAWLSEKFGVKDADAWLATMDAGADEVKIFLERVAYGEYRELTRRMDTFLKVLAASKHFEDRELIVDFMRRMRADVCAKINPARHGKDIVALLCLSEVLEGDP